MGQLRLTVERAQAKNARFQTEIAMVLTRTGFVVQGRQGRRAFVRGEFGFGRVSAGAQA